MSKTKAIIMAAGKGTRLSPLTETVPKPIVRSMGTSTLEENLDNLADVADKVVLVVGYLKEKIIDYIGDNYHGLEIKYVDQHKLKGTAHAAYSAKEIFGDSQIIILNGDDVYEKNVIEKIASLEAGGVAGKVTENWQNYGILKADSEGHFEKIVEKPKEFVGDLVNIGCYKVDSAFFDYFKKIKLSERGEYEITDMLTEYAKDHDVKIVKVESGWYPNSYPWDLLDYTEKKIMTIESKVEGKIEEGATIKGDLILGQNSVIKSGAYLEGNFYIGENCEIGPNCRMKGFGSFDNGAVIGNAVDITRSIIGKGTKIKHLAYVGDSVVGNKVSIGAGSVIANLRHDEQNIKFKVNGKLIDTSRRKMGAVIGDDVRLGANTTVYPGTKIGSGKTTKPGDIVKYQL
ncbi:NTP transferase domain-containing protein [Candidatus Woesebacteria bacterium]|nr:NTP transferase domain-containing protein [Candidatus Woesebacteria bacterium]